MKKIIMGAVALSLFAFMFAISSAEADAEKSVEDHSNYTKTEQCLDCHGSYAEHAKSTAHLGLWNPHDSIHGGYVDCLNCHKGDKLEKNYCQFCHAYNPPKEK